VFKKLIEKCYGSRLALEGGISSFDGQGKDPKNI
jgi:hypothetical protein